jgi:cytochrome c biogenesis protein CcdA
MQQAEKTAVSPPFPSATTMLHASLFVLGFSLIFIIGWGGAATLLGQLFGELKTIIARIGGIVIIAFGLFGFLSGYV